MKAIFSNSNFLLFWAGLTVSKLGVRFFNLIIMWYVIQQTGSSLALGITVICFTLPTLFISPLSGVLADRFDKKKIMVFSDTCNGLILITIAALMLTHSLSMAVLYGLLIASSLASAIFNPAANSSVPLLIEEQHLVKANSLIQFSNQGSNIIGPALAGILLGALNEPGLLLFVSGAAFIISAFMECWLKIPPTYVEEGKFHFKEQIKEGIRFLMKNKNLLPLIVVGGMIINFFLAPLSIYFTVMSEDIFNVGATGLGIINSSLSVGALCGALLILFNVFTDKYKMAIVGLVLEGAGLVLMGSFMHYVSTIAAAWIIGLGISFASVGLNTLYQTIIPKQMLARVLSIVSMLLTISVPLGTLFGSVIINYLPMFIVLIGFGIAVILSSLSLIVIFKQNREEIRKNMKISINHLK